MRTIALRDLYDMRVPCLHSVVMVLLVILKLPRSLRILCEVCAR